MSLCIYCSAIARISPFVYYTNTSVKLFTTFTNQFYILVGFYLGIYYLLTTVDSVVDTLILKRELLLFQNLLSAYSLLLLNIGGLQIHSSYTMVSLYSVIYYLLTTVDSVIDTLILKRELLLFQNLLSAYSLLLLNIGGLQIHSSYTMIGLYSGIYYLLTTVDSVIDTLILKRELLLFQNLFSAYSLLLLNIGGLQIHSSYTMVSLYSVIYYLLTTVDSVVDTLILKRELLLF